MNEKEKNEFYIAMCQCCLIAQAMKTCPLCRFKIGMAEQLKPLDSTTSSGIARLDAGLVVLPAMEQVVIGAETASL